MSDRLTLAHAIEDAGIPRDKAEGMATAIARFVEGNVATKADVQASEAALRTDMQASVATLRSETAALRTELKADIQTVRSEVAVLRAEVKNESRSLENRLMVRLGGGGLVALSVLFALFFAALHAWPPH
jgi:hypothetical protein